MEQHKLSVLVGMSSALITSLIFALMFSFHTGQLSMTIKSCVERLDLHKSRIESQGVAISNLEADMKESKNDRTWIKGTLTVIDNKLEKQFRISSDNNRILRGNR